MATEIHILPKPKITDTDESFRRLELNTSMVLRICKADMTSYNGFIWPEKGHVEAPDWDDTEECGHGLHGWFEAQGDASYSNCLNEPDAKYLVLKVKTDSIIHLDGKCKFPEADVIFVGSRDEAIAYIEETYPYLRTMPLLFANRTVGDSGVVATGDCGTAIAGTGGTAIAGEFGTATVGNYGTATAGFRGTAIAGDCGTATAGKFGTATAGIGGIIQIHYFNDRDRIATGYIGENGLKPNVKYTLDANHNFVEDIS